MRLRLGCLCLLTWAAWVWGQVTPAAKGTSNEQRTSQYLDSVRKQPSLLLAFVRDMPKGADLHNHLSGAVYAENYIRWAAADGLCVNRTSLAYLAPPCDSDKGSVDAQQVLADPGLYQQVINALSLRFFNGPDSGHDHFFNTFGKFGAVSRNHQGEMLAEVVSRAAAQHVSMLALLLSPDNGEAAGFPKKNGIAFNDDLPALRRTMLDRGIANVVQNARHNLDRWEMQMRELMKCGTTQPDPGCDVVLRYQSEMHRGLAPEQVFAELLMGFELASQDGRVLDVNPVMPEDAYIEMRDFDLHMRMFDYLHGLYPNVKLSLHAGELWTGLVPPDGLRFHIRDSINKGHASRIGHGVDVMFEDDPVGLLKEMAAKKIAVEINLTSNDLILGVRGDKHPLPIYMKFGVPVVISTDDEGVSRSDITQEWLRAIKEFGLTYAQIKRMVRDSLEYSFLPGENLWSSGCGKSAKPTAACGKTINGSERAKAQWHLEQQFAQFENKTAALPH